jgi:DNA-binding XRE family transcriptional regulator
MKNNLIYGLRDGRNDTYFYIGKTTVGRGRPLNHLTKSHSKLVNSFVKEIEIFKNAVYIDVIEEDIKLNDLSDREKYWINYYSEIYDLLNIMLMPTELNPEYLKVKNIDTKETETFLNLLINCKNIISNKRKYLKMTQECLAEKSGLNRSTINQIEKGEKTNTNTLIKVLNILSFEESQNQKVKIL